MQYSISDTILNNQEILKDLMQWKLDKISYSIILKNLKNKYKIGISVPTLSKIYGRITTEAEQNTIQYWQKLNEKKDLQLKVLQEEMREIIKDAQEAKKYRCCFCKTPINPATAHDARPIRELGTDSSWCCAECNRRIVIPTRRAIYGKVKEENNANNN